MSQPNPLDRGANPHALAECTRWLNVDVSQPEPIEARLGAIVNVELQAGQRRSDGGGKRSRASLDRVRKARGVREAE